MNSKHIRSVAISFALACLALVVVSGPVFALDTIQEVTNQMLDATAGQSGAGYNTTYANVPNNQYAIAVFIGQIVGYLLSILGALFLGLIVYAGFQWMTAGGNEEQITKAKGLLKNGIIGIALIFGAGLISYFIFLDLLPVFFEGAQ